MKKLNEAICGKKDCCLQDLAMMTEFQHTSINENINAKHNTYFSKQYASDPLQAVVRACLTVIDHNRNADRKRRKDRDRDDKVVTVTTQGGQDSKEGSSWRTRTLSGGRRSWPRCCRWEKCNI
jgi:hypothetical protein